MFHFETQFLRERKERGREGGREGGRERERERKREREGGKEREREGRQRRKTETREIKSLMSNYAPDESVVKERHIWESPAVPVPTQKAHILSRNTETQTTRDTAT